MWRDFKDDIKKGRKCAPSPLILLLSSFFLFSSCTKEPNESPEAMAKVIREVQSVSGNCMCEPYIDRYLWRNKTVYVLAYRGPACNWIPGYYDEEGKPFTMNSSYTYDQFQQEAIRKGEVWQCQ